MFNLIFEFKQVIELISGKQFFFFLHVSGIKKKQH